MPEYKIYVTMDASDKCSGSLLSFRKSWVSAWPVTFDAMTFKGAELNYPVHEKELLAIIQALKKWHVDLLGSEFFVYIDHKMLKNFNMQKDLSHCQAWWMEFMSQFNAKVIYIKGKDNSVANALSCQPISKLADEAKHDAQHPYLFCADDETNNIIASIWSTDALGPWELAKSLAGCTSHLSSANATMNIKTNRKFLEAVKKGYMDNIWCQTLPAVALSFPNLINWDGLWYISGWLIIPRTNNLHETLFLLAHDRLGYFGFDKTYGSLWHAYYWPNMRRDLELSYVPSCPDCQCNKSATIKPYGPLHPLPIPDKWGDSVAIDFISPLPEDNGVSCIVTFTDHLGSNIQLILTWTDITTEDLACIFFDKWYCENDLPTDIISDCDKLFMSHFRKGLHKLTGVKLKMQCITLRQMAQVNRLIKPSIKHFTTTLNATS